MRRRCPNSAFLRAIRLARWPALALWAASIPLLAASPSPPALTPEEKAAMASVTAASLRANLSFLASDELKGRFTPSPELDIAASFIASRFRAAGLEPLGGGDYFLVAHMVRRTPGTASAITIQAENLKLVIPPGAVFLRRARTAVSVAGAPVAWVEAQDPALLDKLDVRHKVVVTRAPDFRGQSGAALEDMAKKARAFAHAIEGSQAQAEIVLGPSPRLGSSLISEEAAQSAAPPVLYVAAEKSLAWLPLLQGSAGEQTVSFSLSAPQDEPVTVRNVAGILRGADPKLKDSVLMVSAHYDHLGTTETAGRPARQRTAAGNGTIFNGANDDGSGTVSVIEIAAALAHLPHRPKRSVLFVTFFGEELGLVGSNYFAEHPPLPLKDFVGDINLEQVGRTDSNQGPQVGTASLTGYDFTTVTDFLQSAAHATGLKLYKDAEASDPFFDRSDNAALAAHGVPAVTLCVAFEYPDYHGLGDVWQKIDYDNMAQVDRTVAVALLRMANSDEAPRWMETNPKVKRYAEAQRREQAKPEEK